MRVVSVEIFVIPDAAVARTNIDRYLVLGLGSLHDDAETAEQKLMPESDVQNAILL